MSLSRKHFREIARILGQNFANDDLINEFVSFCASQNQYFQKQTFLNAIEDNKKIVEDAEAKWNISNRVKNLDDRLVCKNTFK